MLVAGHGVLKKNDFGTPHLLLVLEGQCCGEKEKETRKVQR